MTTNNFSFLEIPDNCWLDKPVFKKMFLDFGELSAADKKALSEDVERIRWRYTLKPDTINIAPYLDDEREYLEIAIISVELTDPKRMSRLGKLIHRAIPYPVVILFQQQDYMSISLAEKRINQADKSKLVIGDHWHTAWISPTNPRATEQQFLRSMGLSALPSSNFYAVYQAMIGLVIALIGAERTGAFKPTASLDTNEQAKALKQISHLEREIATLRAKLKSETQLAKKISLNSVIKKHKDAIVVLETTFIS